MNHCRVESWADKIGDTSRIETATTGPDARRRAAGFARDLSERDPYRIYAACTWNAKHKLWCDYKAYRNGETLFDY